VRDIYPIPRIEQILEALHGKELFTALDIRWGYNNIRIKEEDQWKAVFKTPEGLYKPQVMFFRLTNSPAMFQRTMDRVFQKLCNKYPGMVFVYMDDILVATMMDKALHRQIVHEVLDLLEKESFFLKPSKCKFEQESIDYLGIVVSKGTVRIDPTKQNGLAAWPRKLTSVKQVRSTLGVLGYQRPFIPRFAHLARPLTQLLKKEKKFEWMDECTKALDKLIRIVASDPVLHRLDYTKPFTVEVDASQYATGAILYQENEEGRLCPVGYHSHTLNPAECGYDIHDRELLAVMRGLRQWRHLFLSSPFQTTVVTDHVNLQYYQQPQKINRRIARYLGDLAEYNFKLVHKPGKLNRANHLSRRPDYDEGKEDNREVQVLQDTMFANAVVSLDLEQEIYDAQEGQAAAIAELQKAHGLVSQNHHWFRQGRPVVADKLELKQKILRLYHDHETAGHPGVGNTWIAVARDYWWPDLKKFVTSYVKGCAVCQSTKPNTVQPRVPLFPIASSETQAFPFQMIAWDLITDLPKVGMYDAVLTITDHGCSKAALFFPCTKKIDAEGVATLYAEKVFPHYGVPRKIILDQDPRFTADFAKAVCGQLKIHQNVSTAYHPQTDGQSERANAWLEQYIRIYRNAEQDNWVHLLPLAQYVHNSWTNASTGYAPFELLIGHVPQINVTHEETNVPEVARRKVWLEHARQQAQAAIKAAQNMLITRTQ
jgi:RNase H-like domain found in reverse transcriptase/Reverse transcriptase (RNA-dependent DNA polymerase)/Integrase zinc binding domain